MDLTRKYDKVIFLDIDGVLNSFDHMVRTGEKGKSRFYAEIDPDALAVLKTIIDATGAEIVLSSTWRYGYKRYKNTEESLPYILNTALKEVGLEVVSTTPNLSGRPREEEIHEWLLNNLVNSYLILDDDCDISQTERLIRTSYDYGLTESHVEECIKILNNPII